MTYQDWRDRIDTPNASNGTDPEQPAPKDHKLVLILCPDPSI